MNPKTVKIVPAPQNEIVSLGPEVQEILDVMARIADEPGFRRAFVTDRSAVSDFRPLDMPREEWISRVSTELGVPIVAGNTILVNVARRLREARSV